MQYLRAIEIPWGETLKLTKAKIILSLFLSTFVAQSVFAAVDTSVERYLLEMNISDAIKAEMNHSQFDTSQIIPTTLQSGSSQSTVTQQIFGHMIDNSLNSKSFKRSYIGKKTTSAREALNPQIQFNSKNSNAKIKFQILSQEQKAQLTYNGVVDANVSYQLGVEAAVFRVSKKIDSQTQVSYTLTDNSVETKNLLSLLHQF